MEATITHPEKKSWEAKPLFNVIQPRWQRITLLSILAYEGLGALLGGILLILAPDGRLMSMPAEIMHDVFPDFLIPGIILLFLGIINSAAFILLLMRRPYDWFVTALGIGGLAIWFLTEIAILQVLHWLHILWGLPVLAGCLLCVPLIRAKENFSTTGLLWCGIASSVFYASINLIVPVFWRDYNSAAQTISELSAFGAPTRLLWLLLAIPYSILITAFAWGVLKASFGNRKLYMAGVFLLVYGLSGFLWPLVPMHSRETLAQGNATWTDTAHIAMGAITEIIYLCALFLAAAALGKKFRIYSVATVLTLLIFGFLTFSDSALLAENQPTPYLGVWERINIGVFMAWIIILALSLMKRNQIVQKK